MTHLAAENQQPQRERERRPRVLKGAAILSGMENSEIGCTIRNMHGGGAELRVPADVAVPEQFLLYVPTDRTCLRCERRWRSGERVGVSFHGIAQKPRWHYGG